MVPFYFGPPERRLFGAFHPARVRTGAAVLLCNPFGQEAVRVHRLYRVLAERYARNGVDVLRFDWFGTGDSAGDDVDGELDGWTQDVIAADKELRQRTGDCVVTWIGARLGATLAVKATRLATVLPQHVVLWEPIVDGLAYLQTLIDVTVATIQDSLCIADPRWDALLSEHAQELEREGVGFEVGETLQNQLRGMVPGQLPMPRTERVTVVQNGAHPDLNVLVEQWRRSGGIVAMLDIQHDFDWLAEEVQDAALVPPAILNGLTGMATAQP